MSNSRNWIYNENLTLMCQNLIDSQAAAYVVDKNEVLVIVDDIVIKMFTIDNIRNKLQLKKAA